MCPRAVSAPPQAPQHPRYLLVQSATTLTTPHRHNTSIPLQAWKPPYGASWCARKAGCTRCFSPDSWPSPNAAGAGLAGRKTTIKHVCGRWQMAFRQPPPPSPIIAFHFVNHRRYTTPRPLPFYNHSHTTNPTTKPHHIINATPHHNTTTTPHHSA